jgi:hypothetical protein
LRSYRLIFYWRKIYLHAVKELHWDQTEECGGRRYIFLEVKFQPRMHLCNLEKVCNLEKESVFDQTAFKNHSSQSVLVNQPQVLHLHQFKNNPYPK